MPQVLFVTLGCAKNEVDTDRMRALLRSSGFGEAQTVEEADVALINTCSFLVSATSESIEATLELAASREERLRELPIVMCGCVPSRYGADLVPELPEVAAFVRTDEEDGIVAVVRRVLGMPQEAEHVPANAPLRTVEAASAFVKISDGCDRWCSFCAIPAIRGRYHSRPASEIVAEAVALAQGGVRELVLIGQDTGVWGSDLGEGQTLAGLLAQVAAATRPWGCWVRVLYLQPEGMTDELIAALRDTPGVLPYIDIPVQHCDADILRRMRRSGSEEELRALFARLRREVPGMVVRTTAMAGFPGETDEQAETLVRFLEDEEFDYVSVFSFSSEEGTAAAAMPDQVDEDVKLERTQRLVDVAEALGFAATARHVGERVRVIIDGVEEGAEGPEMIGHAWFQAPDSDGVVHIPYGEASVGDMVTCELVDSLCYELEGRIVETGDGGGSDEWF